MKQEFQSKPTRVWAEQWHPGKKVEGVYPPNPVIPFPHVIDINGNHIPVHDGDYIIQENDPEVFKRKYEPVKKPVVEVSEDKDRQVVCLAFTLKDQPWPALERALREFRSTLSPDVMVFHGHMTRREVDRRGFDTKLVDLLDELFCYPADQTCFFLNGNTNRQWMASAAKSVGAQPYVIGKIDAGVKEEVELYEAAGLKVKVIPLEGEGEASPHGAALKTVTEADAAFLVPADDEGEATIRYLVPPEDADSWGADAKNQPAKKPDQALQEELLALNTANRALMDNFPASDSDPMDGKS